MERLDWGNIEDTALCLDGWVFKRPDTNGDYVFSKADLDFLIKKLKEAK
jgi:hypothetical protein